MGLQTLNPHDLTRGPGNSSGGTGAAIAAAFAQFGLGTDTAGSIRGPSAANGIVGLKTTLGLVSRTGVLPLANYDTVGALARNVYDVAVALNVLAGSDPSDSSTRQNAGKVESDYTKFLKSGSLKGARIGVGRDFAGPDPETIAGAASGAPAAPAVGGESASLFADETGFPDISVPAGMTKDGLPVTLSFMGQAFSEPMLLGYAYDFEQATRARVLPKYTPALPGEAIAK